MRQVVSFVPSRSRISLFSLSNRLIINKRLCALFRTGTPKKPRDVTRETDLILSAFPLDEFDAAVLLLYEPGASRCLVIAKNDFLEIFGDPASWEGGQMVFRIDTEKLSVNNISLTPYLEAWHFLVPEKES